MPAHLSSLSALPFVLGNHPLESKQVGPDPKVARVRFEAGFEDPSWCTRSHVILVEEGALTLELEGGMLTVQTGEIVRLTEGTRHRASNRGAVRATLLIVSDLVEAKVGSS